MKTLLWLVFSPIEQPYKVVWCKSYNDFIEEILFNGLPDAICFDHDLSDFQAFKAGYHKDYFGKKINLETYHPIDYLHKEFKKLKT